MGVELEKDIAVDLILYKLGQIKEEIELILTRWNYSSPQQFIDDTKSGKLSEAENDAIDLRELVLEEEKLSTLYARIQ